MKASFSRYILIITIIISGFIISPSYAKTIQLDQSLTEIPITPFSEYIEDIDGKLTLQDLLDKSKQNHWTSTDKKILGFGFTNSVYWLRFTIENKTDSEFKFFIEQAYPMIDSIRLFVPDTNGFRMIEVGDRKPFSERPYEHKNFVFPLRLKAQSASTYYMRFESESSMNLLLSVWALESFRSKSSTEYRMLMLFYGIFMIMLVYNFIIFFFVRRIEYLFYVLFTLCLVMFLMSLNGTAYQFLWPDSPGWANFCIPFLLQLVILSLWFFFIELSELRTVRKDIPYREAVFKGSLVLLAIIVIILITIMFVKYRIAMALTAAYTGIFMLGVLVIALILVIKERHRPILFGLAASSALVTGGMLYIFKSFGIIPSNILSEWSMYIGTVIMLTIFSISLADRINTMRKSIEKAEKKYRNLVESSSDIIFSLDENNIFTSVNSKFKKQLGFAADDIIGTCFLDYIQETWSEKQQIARRIVEEYINDLKQTKESVSFRADFKTKYSHEPKELTVKLELSDALTEEGIILGKASLVTDDTILQYLESEEHTYQFENYLNNAELISQRLTRNLNKRLSAAVVSEIRISLREILLNSIEHGNLNINFDEKTQAIIEDNYLDFIQQRQKDPGYRDKKVQIEYLLSKNSVEYRIRDEGEGFDSISFLDLEQKKQNMEMALAHGRGITMATNTFDNISYNEKGNEVSLIKYFSNK